MIRSVVGVAGFALLGSNFASAQHDALYPVSCTQDCTSSGSVLTADLMKGLFKVSVDNVDANPSFDIVGPAEIQIHAGYGSTTAGSCSNGFAMFDGYNEEDYTKMCKGVNGQAEGDFTKTAVVEVANVDAKGSKGTLEGDDFNLSVQLLPGATWVEVGPEFVGLDASVRDQEFIWKDKDYGSIEGGEQTALGVWGPAEVEFVGVDLRTNDFLNLRNGDWESERFHLNAAPSYKIYAPEGLNHIEYVAQASTEASSHSGFDVRVRPAQPLVEVVEQSPTGADVVTIQPYDHQGAGNSWDYRGCTVVKSSHYNVDESAKVRVNYDARVFSVASDLERDSRDSSCNDDYLLIGGNKFCYGVSTEPTEEQKNGSSKFFHAAAGDVVEYFSDSKDAGDEGRSGWSFIICPTCDLCSLNFAAPAPTFDMIRFDEGRDYMTVTTADDGSLIVFTDAYPEDMDVVITLLKDVDVNVMENDLEKGGDGANSGSAAYCEDDYIIVGSNDRMCLDHNRTGLMHATKDEKILIHTDYGDDDTTSSHKLKFSVKPTV